MRHSLGAIGCAVFCVRRAGMAAAGRVSARGKVMPRPALDSKPRLAPGCRLSDAPNQEATLLMPEGALKLKGPGLQIVRSCDGEHTFEEIIRLLQKQFGAADPKKIEDDVAGFLEHLHNRRAIDF
ncbi:MAG: pyrroloquinoline quinone biosynthesis peptide chaperone PqqD [Candidatus Acidiferrales bacterium]